MANSTGRGDDSEPGSPRLEPGPTSSAPSLLVTALAEFVHPSGEPDSTATLARMLTDAGLEESAARQAVTRGAAAGWLERRRPGRESRWVLGHRAIDLINDREQRSRTVRVAPGAWHGEWLILLVTLSRGQKAGRRRLYNLLDGQGFGNPAAGVWVCPHPERATEARKILDEMGLRGSTLAFTGSSVSVGLSDAELVDAGWDLAGLEAEYRLWIDRYQTLEPDTDIQSLAAYLSLLDEWARLAGRDPRIPSELLPDWVGHAAEELFETLRDRWSGPARRHWELLNCAGPAPTDAPAGESQPA